MPIVITEAYLLTFTLCRFSLSSDHRIDLSRIILFHLTVTSMRHELCLAYCLLHPPGVPYLWE